MLFGATFGPLASTCLALLFLLCSLLKEELGTAFRERLIGYLLVLVLLLLDGRPPALLLRLFCLNLLGLLSYRPELSWPR